ncbi:hypothetical protein P691DRAFT_760528 [Macrolepiota fuliginosa MF-IS2]|uniref:JmjC domain-containing protein n=1 Tax=Macrolepiota fuliginosa MF-IS2 TaxID=1400762 RepID=A0A9P5XCC0_9AGAR|nr:hypothetical protein P691DRAFT_760528 [Macrolepiota fuliginosa MF-IS2]
MAEESSQILAATSRFEETSYTLFFSNKILALNEGEIGDIWLVCPEGTHHSAFSQQIINGGSRLMLTEFGGKPWVKLGNGWEEINKTPTSLSQIEHPEVKGARLDLTHLNWRSKNSISSQQSQERKRRKMDSGNGKDIQKHLWISATHTLIAPQAPDSSVGKVIHGMHDCLEEVPSPTILNPWILPLFEEWDYITKVKNIDLLVGREGLQALLEHPDVLEPRGPPSSSIITTIHELICTKHPTRSDISEEWLANHHRAQFASCVSLCWGATKKTELLSMIKLPDPSLVELCELDVPEEIKEKAGRVFHEREDGAKYPWHYMIVPGAGITFSHVDTWTGCTYISHFSGKKLWLFWPGTLENYRVLYSRLLKGGDHHVLPAAAIWGLSGLEVMLVDDTWRPCWIMAPGTIHCVMTFNPLVATHGGFNFYYLNCWKESQKPSLAMVELIDKSLVCGDANASWWLEEMVVSLGFWDEMESQDGGLELWLSALREKLKSARTKTNRPADREPIANKNTDVLANRNPTDEQKAPIGQAHSEKKGSQSQRAKRR